MTTETARGIRYVLCLNNDGYPVSLENGRIYEVLPEGRPERGLIRVVDESGEDYLYPAERFAPVEGSQVVADPTARTLSTPLSDLEREARRFLEENAPLLEEGSASALGRVFVQGANIATALSAEAVEAANRAASVTRALGEAIENPATPALRIQELETERERVKEIHEHRSRFFEEFAGFLDVVSSARRQRKNEER